MYKPYKKHRKLKLEERIDTWTKRADFYAGQIQELSEIAVQRKIETELDLETFEQYCAENERSKKADAPEWSGYLGTIGLIFVNESGTDAMRKQNELRSACDAHGFQLDGAWLQEPFDKCIWPYEHLQFALDGDFEVLVVQHLGEVATHERAPSELPGLMRKHGVLLYSLAHRRTFEPDDLDLELQLAIAYKNL